MPPTKKTTHLRKAADELKSGSDHEQEMAEIAAPDPAVEQVCTCEGDILIVGGNCSTCGLVVRL